MILGAKQGANLRIRVEGSDAPEAMQQIERLISWLDEDRDTNGTTRPPEVPQCEPAAGEG
jgi:hypothetical protein